MNSYPVNLLLKNRRCLIAGGGPVALRKAARLLAADAQVIVVAPDVVVGLEKLAADGRLEITLRKCRAEDLNGVFLAFFATDDHKFNQQMLLAAQAQGVLSCAVDKNWSAGDFITPASCDGSGLQLAIATGGGSCTRAKSLKNLLSGQLEILGAKVVLTTFTVADRLFDDNFSALSGEVADALKYISGVREFFCRIADNRFELVALLGADAKINRLVRLLLIDLVDGSIDERCGIQAFRYVVLKNLTIAKTQADFTINKVATGFLIGSGLKKLDMLVGESAGLPYELDEKWEEYEYYCRKL